MVILIRSVGVMNVVWNRHVIVLFDDGTAQNHTHSLAMQSERNLLLGIFGNFLGGRCFCSGVCRSCFWHFGSGV